MSESTTSSPRVGVAAQQRRVLLDLLRPDAMRWVGLGLLITASSAGALAGPLVVRSIVDRARGGTTTAQIVGLGVVFLVIAIITQILSVIVVRGATTAAWSITNSLRLDITRHVLGLDHEFHRRHTPGELIQRVDGDVTNVSDFLSQVLPRIIGAVMLVGGMLVVLAVLDWRLGAGMVVFLVAAAALVLSMRHRAVEESSDEMGAMGRLYGGIEEKLNAAEDLRANGAEAHAMWRFVEDSSEALRYSVRREAAFLRMWWALEIAVISGNVAALAVSAVLVQRGYITLGTAFLLFQYVLLIMKPLEDLVHQMETVQKANGAMRRVAELTNVAPTVLDLGRTSPSPGPLSVTCQGVGFAYGDDGQTILDGIDAHVEAGRSVGVVGRTGSGKTTFSRLLLRLVEPTRGNLLLGGVPIADIPMDELRQRIAMVPQEVELFEGTIRDNVTLFDTAPADHDVEAALRHVGLDRLVATGIHEPLGSGGAGLSAGQSQLLALARVWLRQPDLVVLDEATARVDPETEQRIAAAVAQLMVGRTTFIIAHRLSTLDAVDEIMVFDAGHLAEHGDRSTLVRNDSRFRRLLELALATDSDGDVDSLAASDLGGPIDTNDGDARREWAEVVT